MRDAVTSKLKTLLAGYLCATLFFFGDVTPSAAAEFRVEITGVVSDIMAMVDPASDWAGPPPEVAPDFAARFGVGQSVSTEFTIADGIVDGLPAINRGQYSLSGMPIGSVVVDGDQYQLRPGSIHIRTEETDSYFFLSYTSQEISDPISARGIMLNIVLEGHGLLHSDALVPPPQSWDVATGELYFDTWPFWQGIRLSIDRVEVNAVPETSFAAIAAVLFGIVGCSRRTRKRCEALAADTSAKVGYNRNLVRRSFRPYSAPS